MLAQPPTPSPTRPTDELPTGRPIRGGRLPQPLAARYGGELAIPLQTDRPTLVANFVATLDGVVSYNTPEAAGGGEVSGFFEPDRFLMGLLRALSDVVLVGAGTVRAAPSDRWTPGFIHPQSADAFAALRSELGLAGEPTTVVVTASGLLDPAHPGLSDPAVPVLLVTTPEGADRLQRGQVPGHVGLRICAAPLTAHDILAAVAGAQPQLVLCEGGPRLFGQLAAARLVDELFLTLAPQLAGRSATTPRLALVEDIAFDVDSAPWPRLVDVRRAADHLFTRYRFRRN